MPTSRTYYVLWSRGCAPWRPDAAMGRTRVRVSLSFSFYSRTVGSMHASHLKMGVEASASLRLCLAGRGHVSRLQAESHTPTCSTCTNTESHTSKNGRMHENTCVHKNVYASVGVFACECASLGVSRSSLCTAREDLSVDMKN